MNSSKKLFLLSQQLCKVATRNASGGAPSPRFSKVKAVQETYAGRNKPSYLIGGQLDRVLVAFTYALVGTGTALGLQTFYTLVFKR